MKDHAALVKDDITANTVEWVSPERDAQEMAALVRALKLAKGFSLLFVICDRAPDRDRAIGKIKERLTGWSIMELSVPPNTISLLQFLQEQVALARPAPDAIFLIGIENWLAASDEAAHSPFVVTLNHTRNRFPKRVRCPLVTWCPEHVMATIAQGAPDFYSVRSGVYPLSGADERRDVAVSRGGRSVVAGSDVNNSIVIAGTGGRSVSPSHNLSDSVVITGSGNTINMGSWAWGEVYRDSRNQRLNELIERLERYDSLPLEQRDELLEASLASQIGNLCLELGRYGYAEQWLLRALQIRERVLGPDHTDTAVSLDDLATLKFAQGDFAAAENIARRSLDTHEALQGRDHPAVASSLNNLATVFINQGNDVAAEPLYLRAVSILDRVFGPDSPPTAAALSNLASLYKARGNFVAAEPLLVRALAVREKTLGPEHPDTAISLSNLATVYMEQGKNAAAKPLLQRALAIFEKILGPEHPMTLNARRTYLAFNNNT